MAGKPLITVVTAVHNDERFLPEAIRSVLGQTLDRLRYVIVDDASTDATPDLLAAVTDPRVEVRRTSANLGPAGAANLGLEGADTPYVARLDSDDIAEPDRLARQVAWLEGRPEIDLLGSDVMRIDEAGAPLGRWRMPADDLAIRWMNLTTAGLIHSTVVWRTARFEALGLRYDPALRVSVDFDLYARALPHMKAANLPEPLVRYRLRSGLTRRQRPEQLQTADRIALRSVEHETPGLGWTLDDIRALRHMLLGDDLGRSSRPDRATLRLQLDLLDAFLARHADAPGRTRLQRHVAARLGVRSLRFGHPSLLPGLWRRSPLLPLDACVAIAGELVERQRRRPPSPRTDSATTR